MTTTADYSTTGEHSAAGYSATGESATAGFSAPGGRDATDVLHHPLDAIRSLVPPDTMRVVNDLPRRLQTELRERPYRTLGVTLALGVGIGALASSRVTRFLVMNLGSFALTEMARRGASQYLQRLLATS